MNLKIKIHIVEDDPFILNNLAFLIKNNETFSYPVCFDNAEDFLKAIRSSKPRIVLMDISLPHMNGIEAVKAAKKIYPDLDIIMLTVHQEDEKVFDSLCAGASGYLLKSTGLPRIISAIKETLNGGAPMSSKIANLVVRSFHQSRNPTLTNREKDVLQLLCKGKSYQTIAETLFISSETVRTHIKHIYKKLEVHSNTEAVAKAYKDKLI